MKIFNKREIVLRLAAIGAKSTPFIAISLYFNVNLTFNI